MFLGTITPAHADNAVVLLLLTSGQQIIGRYKLVDNQPRLLKARMVVVQPGPGGNFNIGLLPLGLPLFDEHDAAEMAYPHSTQVLLSKLAPKELANNYLANVSGLQAANRPIPGVR